MNFEGLADGTLEKIGIALTSRKKNSSIIQIDIKVFAVCKN